MTKFSTFAIAAALGFVFLAPTTAPVAAEPCDHCTMPPIVVKGERPKKKSFGGSLAIKQFRTAVDLGQASVSID